MLVSLVLCTSLILQFVAAYFALRLVKVTGKSLAWSLIAAAITLMAVRRSISLLAAMRAASGAPPDLTVELIALTISVLMAIGIERIAPIFRGFAEVTQTLRESEARYRALFESSPEAIFIADPTTARIVDANPKAVELVGRSYETLVGLEQFRLHPAEMSEESRVTFRSHVEQVMSGRVAGPLEYFVARSDGTSLPVEIQSKLVVIGGRAHIQGVFRDVSERARAASEIRALNQALEQRVAERTAQLEHAYQELEAFSYSVSHDLRAPLRAIGGFSRLLAQRSQANLDDEGRRHLTLICAGVTRMGRMIEDILEFSRASRREPSASTVEMSKLVHEVFDEVRGAVPERSVELRLGALPAVRGDAAMLRQLLVNLVSNSVKFSAPRTKALIEVDAELDGSMATFRVKDNGVGFDMGHADKLFGVFQRLHGVSEFEGTGLGLAIARRIVERHGGRIWAEGEVDVGATIHFALPRDPEVARVALSG